MNNLNSVLALQFGFNAMDATKPPYLILHQVSAFQGITKIGSKVPKTYFSDWIIDKKPNQWPFSLFKQWIWCLKTAWILNFTFCKYLLDIRNFDKSYLERIPNFSLWELIDIEHQFNGFIFLRILWTLWGPCCLL